MAWVKGQSGNPGGRRPGAIGVPGKARLAISKAVPGILNTLIAQAQGGDTSAARLLLERVVPPLRATDEPTQPLAIASLSEAPSALLAALGAGVLSVDQVAQLANALANLARVSETVELEARIRNLEARHG